MKELRWRANAVLGIVLAALSALAAAYLVPAQVRAVAGFGVPAYVYPRVVLSLCTAAGLAVALNSWRRKAAEPVDGEPLTRTSLAAAASVTGLVLLYAGALHLIGFLYSTPFFLMACMALFGERSWLLMIAVSILVPLSVYGLFTGVLQLVLP